jgi:monovalent cation:H+ antiporter, CPA1 family
VFFLVGAALDPAIVIRDPVFVIATLVGVAVARVAVSGLLLPAGYPREWLDVVRVAGVRGALSLALAIALPPGVPQRDLIIAATFAVALATIVSSGLTVPPVVARVARARR